MSALDKFDIRLLNLLQCNNLQTADDMTQKVPLSPSAITRRLRRLRNSGLIRRDISLLSKQLFERWMKVVVHVKVRENANSQAISALLEHFSSEPQIQTCLEISGAVDILLIAVVRDMSEFDALATRAFDDQPLVARYETLMVRREMKNHPAVWLDEDGDRATVALGR